MYEALLAQTGLSANQSLVYELLLKEGTMKASKISQKTALKRGLTYKILEELVDLKLAKKEEPTGKIATFTAEHPAKLREMIAEREASQKRALEAVNQLIPRLASDYNLALNKPGVRFFEGLEGIRQVWWDSLDDTDEILTYLDLAIVAKEFGELNEEYFRERQRRQIPKRAIANDSEFNRQFLKGYDQAITQVRLLPDGAVNFSAVTMHIYRNRISYTTLSGGSMIGIIIEDPLIYTMQRELFEHTWQSLAVPVTKKSPEPKPATPSPTPSTPPVPPAGGPARPADHKNDR